jgi:hypothetical protein
MALQIGLNAVVVEQGVVDVDKKDGPTGGAHRGAPARGRQEALPCLACFMGSGSAIVFSCDTDGPCRRAPRREAAP